MAYDELLAERIRPLLAHRTDADERRLFSGLSFFVNGNLAVAVRGDNLLVRVGTEAAPDLLKSEPEAEQAVMGKRTMKAWLEMPGDALSEDGDLERWVRRGEGFAAELPPK